jgi:hypothetical protein
MHHLTADEGLGLAAKADFLAPTASEAGLFGWVAIMHLIFVVARYGWRSCESQQREHSFDREPMC